jgi:hypothetical protein
LKRREFLRLLALSTLSVGCSPVGRGSATLPTDPPINALPRAGRVWAWLRTFRTSGEYGIPSSEESYEAHRSLIHVAMPLNGGKLQADGSWLQEEWKIDNDWAQRLRGTVKRSGQLYLPGVFNDPEGIKVVLDNPTLMQRAAENLVRLAIERFDAPWDGVMLDLERIPFEYSEQLSAFLRVLTARIKGAGLLAGVSTRGRAADEGKDPPDSYTYDFSVVGEVADYVDLRCHNYWTPRPRSIGPLWWLEACIEYAEGKGIAADRICLGPGTFTKLWFDSDENYSEQITYDQAMDLLAKTGAKIEWVEDGPYGLVGEKFAQVGEGHFWMRDAETCARSLQVIDEHRLKGISLFAPGMEDPLQWTVVGEWLRRNRVRLPAILAASGSLAEPSYA